MFDDRIPIVEITSKTVDRLLPVLRDAVKAADFIAIDLELSGIGSYHGLKGKPFQDRFTRIRDTVLSRSVLSIGIATFKLKKVSEERKKIKLEAMVFNLITMSAKNFTVEPDALSFLARHGFDFNRLIDSAVGYNCGQPSHPLSTILIDILTSGASLIFHNGFIDCAFLYHHFFSTLPASVGCFQSSLCDWFSVTASENLDNGEACGGRGLFYDNKFIAAREGLSATFLEYVFRKHQRANVLECQGAKVYLAIKFTELENPEPGDIEYVDCEMSPHFLRNDFSIHSEAHASLCTNYAEHGFCRRRTCEKTHEVDLLLDLECQKSLKEQGRRKRKLAAIVGEEAVDARKKFRPLPGAVQAKVDAAIEADADQAANDTESSCSDNGRPYEKTKFSTKGCHRAGMDAFMTGFGVLFSQRMHILRKQCLDPTLANKTTCAGLDAPSLPFVKSTYSPTSAEHKKKWEVLAEQKAKAVKEKLRVVAG
uniref:C3H1-type domain-containing protein n=2 Tax=Panagrellus redivivus TaxID=6233 RepID=A0A7E4V8C2_PANRE